MNKTKTVFFTSLELIKMKKEKDNNKKVHKNISHFESSEN